jgi:hypothetical protein
VFRNGELLHQGTIGLLKGFYGDKTVSLFIMINCVINTAVENTDLTVVQT